MEVVGSIDQGTQSTRFTLYDRDAKSIGSYRVEFSPICPKPGWCEHDPETIWNSVVESISKCVEAAEKTHGPLKVLSIGITNQRETTLVWDRATGKPLYTAIVWLDCRTRDVCKKLVEEVGDKDYFREVTGLPVSTYFSGVKLRWMIENIPEVKEAVEAKTCCFGTVETWLIYKLTGGDDGGVHATDVSNASRTLMMDLGGRKWHEPYLKHFGANIDIMPRILSNVEVFGHVKEGPLKGVPIGGSLGDQQAAILGQRCMVGEAKNTYGTGCFMLLNTGDKMVPSTHGLLSTMAWQLGPEKTPQYALEGSVAMGGATISWLRDQLGIISTAAESESVASGVTDTGGVYFVPAFSGLLAPHWRDDARGVIVGLTGYSTKAHIVRAALEAICFQTREILDAMRKDADLEGLKKLKVDGGAAENTTLMQIQADLLQVEVERPEDRETTSLGAAFAAGLSVGFYTEQQIFENRPEGSDSFQPKVAPAEAEKRYSKWHKAVLRSMDLEDLAE
ncbi:hypothetical protein BSKO_05158 [Bryopsis sp. KO-2023]|nr:hypothetical protein BSKO_05158 [Bryopsis sp. KO-2023]